MTEEAVLDPVKLFGSSSRKQRMFEYALMRTPQWSVIGKQFLLLLAEVIEEDQPTPQVSFNGSELVCTWLVDSKSIELVVDNEDGGLSFWLYDDDEREPAADGWEFTADGVDELASVLREKLTRLGKSVNETNRLVK